jgi:hypothetical protein
MDEHVERTVRDLMLAERFGVLATAADGRVHASTILFAATPAWELVHAIRPATLKAHLISASPTAAFQVDNRSVVETDRNGFVRVTFEGAVRRLYRGDPAWSDYHEVFAGRHPFGAALLSSPEIEMYVLTPEVMRIAIGAAPPEDIHVARPEPQSSWT